LLTNSGPSAVYFYQLSGTSASTWTASLFAKKGTNKNVGISICAYSYVDSRYQPVFDLSNGTLLEENISGSNNTNTSYKIEEFANGWYRISATATFAAGADHCYMVIQHTNSDTITKISDTLDWTNATNGTAYYWGLNLTKTAYLQSYIPTQNAAVTRVADAAYKTGISSLIGQTAGSVFAEGYVQDGQESMMFWIKADTGTYTDFIALIFNSSRVPELSVYTGGVIQAYITGTAVAEGYHKIAVGYANNDFVVYVDGVQIGTDTSGTVPTCSQFFIDQYTDGGIRNVSKKQALLFKTRLTNAQLAELTTL
jgi:hypothetical protein